MHHPPNGVARRPLQTWLRQKDIRKEGVFLQASQSKILSGFFAALKDIALESHCETQERPSLSQRIPVFLILFVSKRRLFKMNYLVFKKLMQNDKKYISKTFLWFFVREAEIFENVSAKTLIEPVIHATLVLSCRYCTETGSIRHSNHGGVSSGVLG